MTKARDLTLWADWDDITDFDLFIIDNNPVNEQFDELATLGEVQMVQGGLEPLAEILNIDRECGQIDLFLRLGIQLSELLLQSTQSLSHFMAFAFKFISADDFSQVDFKQSFLLSLELGNRLVQGLATGLKRLRQPFAGLSSFQFMSDAGRIGQNVTEIPPNEVVQLLGWDVTSNATFAFGLA
jgi:hypothetical protein